MPPPSGNLKVYGRREVLAALKQYWGYDELRPGQAEAVRCGLYGRDSLLVMPTGGGKSLCFQLPAVVREGLTVVVSPLLALMKDQVDGLCLNGFPAATLNSHLPPDEQREIEARVRDGEIKLLYVSAKRIFSSGFERLARNAGVHSFVIDEAHCISQWGHDFVPEYRQLSNLRTIFPGISVHAFTATATPRVQTDICQQLNLFEPDVMVGAFDRPNLMYEVRSDGGDRKEIVAEILRPYRDSKTSIPADGAAIVYCIKRKDTEAFAEFLTSKKIRAKAYHAGMAAPARKKVQDDFVNERLSVVVATVAFGMGIDRGDVRMVIHANMPKTIEAYQQETGRAGRDGLPSRCIMLHSYGDEKIWEFLIDRSTEAIEEPDVRRAVRNEQLKLMDHMATYCKDTGRCRHVGVVRYFGQTIERALCGACDVCRRRAVAGPHALLAIEVAAAVAGMGSMHQDTLVSVLAGECIPSVLGSDLHATRAFGHLSNLPKETVAAAVAEMIEKGVLSAQGETLVAGVGGGVGGGVGAPPPKGFTLSSLATALRAPSGTSAAPSGPAAAKSWKKPAAGAAVDGTPEGGEPVAADVEFADYLRGVRKKIASELGVPPFVIFSDATMHELIRTKPVTTAQLISIKGFTMNKHAMFGAELIGAIVRFEKTRGPEAGVAGPVTA